MADAQYKIEKLTKDQLLSITKQTIDNLRSNKVTQFVIDINEPTQPPSEGKIKEDSKLFVDRFGGAGMNTRTHEFIIFTPDNKYVGYIRQKPKQPNVYNMYISVDGSSKPIADANAIAQIALKHFGFAEGDTGARSRLITSLFNKL